MMPSSISGNQIPNQAGRSPSPVIAENIRGEGGGGTPQAQVQGNRSSTLSGSDSSSQIQMDYTPAPTQSEAAAAAQPSTGGVKRSAAAEDLSSTSAASPETADCPEHQA